MNSSAQLTLEFDAGLTERYRCLRDCMAAGIYQRGLKRVAADLDVAPGNLSCMVSDESQRKFGVDDLERYIQTQGDLTPIHYLIARYMGDGAVSEANRTKRVESLLTEIASIVGQRKTKRK